MRDIFTMREVARLLDARNRTIPPAPIGYAGYRSWPDPEGRARGDYDYDGPVCRINGCDNLLTISDYTNVCRECKLSR